LPRPRASWYLLILVIDRNFAKREGTDESIVTHAPSACRHSVGQSLLSGFELQSIAGGSVGHSQDLRKESAPARFDSHG
jgi:hypothetical protein